ncbi:MAG: CRISPR-associated endonuclease Cas2 [Ruminococcus sp.]|nr:CRISPR-associated endonuclease Cas2 [Ruminococcus sp.]
MMELITYDVDFTESKGAKRLRKVAKICEKYGVRVQNSVFEIIVDPAQLAQIRLSLIQVIDEDLDSIRIYHLGNNWNNKIEMIGTKRGFSQDEPLLL